MKHNMNFTDRMTRMIVAVVFIALYLSEVVTGIVGILMLVISVIFAATAIVSYCPLYTFFGIHKWEKKT